MVGRGSRHWGLGGLHMVDMDCPPDHVVLICRLVCVGDPFYQKGALPSWCQLTCTLRRSSHHEDEVIFAIWIDGHRSWRWGHLLVSEGETLAYHLNISDRVLYGWGSTGVALKVRV